MRYRSLIERVSHKKQTHFGPRSSCRAHIFSNTFQCLFEHTSILTLMCFVYIRVHFVHIMLVPMPVRECGMHNILFKAYNTCVSTKGHTITSSYEHWCSYYL